MKRDYRKDEMSRNNINERVVSDADDESISK